MRNDFCVFILTHGRPDNVVTYEKLRQSGYTGKIYIVIDDEDNTEHEYRKRYGSEVLQFSKEELSKIFDEGDNFDDRRTITYARNACWQLAKQVGVKYFIQLDDDYYWFGYRQGAGYKYGGWTIRGLDGVLSALVAFLEDTPALTVTFSQGGDHIGGADKPISMKRKSMNSFVCDVDKPFLFVGRFNEDVNTYTSKGHRGALFFTYNSIQIDQKDTQSSGGGITDLYLRFGTFVKAFTTVMYSPSFVHVREMGEKNKRLHHAVSWNNAVPKILRESVKK